MFLNKTPSWCEKDASTRRRIVPRVFLQDRDLGQLKGLRRTSEDRPACSFRQPDGRRKADLMNSKPLSPTLLLSTLLPKHLLSGSSRPRKLLTATQKKERREWLNEVGEHRRASSIEVRRAWDEEVDGSAPQVRRLDPVRFDDFSDDIPRKKRRTKMNRRGFRGRRC
ncbi:hypothetical protein BDY24DRAFT_1154 [Mrakia frigida]|uniref:uncharacterized protein n=1 Tax=Mrakia frigida TaxID=29902 RepID=UPI003FCBF9D6